MPLYIDLPETMVGSFSVMIAGWVAGDHPASDAEILVDGVPVGSFLYDRPDLATTLAGYQSRSGVCSWLNLLTSKGGPTITIGLRYGDEFTEREVAVAGDVLNQLPAQRALRDAARAWVEPRLRCPSCGAPRRRLDVDASRIACGRCGTAFPRTSAAFNLISPKLGLSSNLSHTARPSSNPYDPEALSVIEATVKAGGWVLDCGAGARPVRRERVINVEIEDYFSTDVLAVGESLPFESEVFDAVVSLAVLEHVRDPFVCAKELLRVLRPGGTLIASVPFLQPVHGYPNHYYNMSQQGLRNLFEGEAETLACFVPAHGHPFFTLNWFAREYLAGLDGELRREVAAMTLGELAVADPLTYVTTPAARSLARETQNVIACLNTVVMRKL